MRETYDHFCEFFKQMLTPHVWPPRTDPKIAHPVFFKLNMGGVILKFQETTLILMIFSLFLPHMAWSFYEKNHFKFLFFVALKMSFLKSNMDQIWQAAIWWRIICRIKCWCFFSCPWTEFSGTIDQKVSNESNLGENKGNIFVIFSKQFWHPMFGHPVRTLKLHVQFFSK